MPTTPPVVPTYAGPSIKLRPTAVSISVVSAPNYPWVNQSNLVGAIDGIMATSTIPITSAGTTGDKLLLAVAPPQALLPCYILGYAYELRTVSSTAAAAFVGISFQIATKAGVVKGGQEQVHEFNSTPADWGMAEYAGSEAINIADRITQFQQSVSIGVTNCATLADLGGFAIQIGVDTNSTGSATVTLDTADLTVFYVPQPRGTIVSVAIDSANVAAVTASTAGIALDAAWGPETAWTNIAQASTVGTPGAASSASATQQDTDQASQTQFIKFPVAANGITTLIGKKHQDLQIIWRGRYSGGGAPASGTATDYTKIGEIAILKSDGTVLLKAVNAGKLQYLGANFKVNNQNDVASAERDVPYVVDISGLTTAQILDMNTNGFSVLIRWNISTLQNGGGSPGAVFTNGITLNASYLSAGGAGGLDTGGRLTRTNERAGRMQRMTR